MEFLKEIKDVFRNHIIWTVFFFIVQFTISMPVHVYLKDVFCIYTILLLWRKYIDLTALLLVCFSLTYIGIYLATDQYESFFECLAYLVGPVSYYMIGKKIVTEYRTFQNITTFLLLFTIATIIFISVVTFVDVQVVGMISENRNLLETDQRLIAATIRGIYVAIGFSGIAYIISFMSFWKLKPVLFMICTLASLLVVVHSVTRTGLFIMLITIFVSILYTIKSSWRSFCVIILIFGLLYYSLDKLGFLSMDVIDAYLARENDEGHEIAQGGNRTERWAEAINYFYHYPMGWSSVVGNLYAHNLWLDIARISGIIPFLLLMVVTLNNIWMIFRLFMIKNTPFVGYIIGVNICLFTTAMVEPLLEASSTAFFMLCMIWGINGQTYINLKNNHVGNQENMHIYCWSHN